jgi:hypothetical protein
MDWEEVAACRWDMRNSYEILVLEPEGSVLLEDVSLGVSVVRPNANGIK